MPARCNARLDEADQLGIYRDPRAQNYYTNAFGRGAVNNPFDGSWMWRWLRDPRADEIDPSLPPDARFVHARLGADVVVG